MNILYLCTDPGIPVLGRKGASIHVRALVSAFSAAGHAVAVAAPLLAADGDVPASIDAQVLHVAPSDTVIAAMDAVKRSAERVGAKTTIANELRRILYNEELERDVVARVGHFAFDCVYERATVYGTAGVGIARRLGAPHVVELNAPLALEQSTYRGTNFPDLAREAERYTLSHAEAVLAVSAPLREYVVAQGIDANRVHVLPNGVDPSVFAPAAPSHAVRKRLGIGAGPVIGFVGGLRPWHGVRALPALVERLAVRYPRLQLVIAGEGPLRQQLTLDFADRDLLDHVRFIGSIPHAEVADVIRTFDIAVAPYEPTEHLFYFSPLKLFEYMGCGVAVVAASIGQIADVVRDGEHGLLYSAGDQQALGLACERLLADPDLRRGLGRNAAVMVHNRFTWQRNAATIVDLVEGARARQGVA